MSHSSCRGSSTSPLRTRYGSSAAAPLLGNAVSFAPAPSGSMTGLTSTAWTNLSSSRDLALELRFVPAPGACVVIALGSLAAARRRR